jgi:2'-hydroxyisoflavone reductase
MRLLILGGTRFLGRHVVDAALAHGHTVTTFTRGAHDSVLPEEVERLHGDRDGDLTDLSGRRWDGVVDTSGYVPRVVRTSAELLARATDTYAFISTISVYRDFPAQAEINEDGAVGKLEDETTEAGGDGTYGPLKALCEGVVREVFGTRAVVIRPGLIVGPYDPTNRFTYWPQRIAEGGEVLAPGRPERVVQFIDARDLADWTVHLVEHGGNGTYNATGPDRILTMGEVLKTAQGVVDGAGVTLTWVSDEFLVRQGVGPWMEVPLWAPEAEAPGLGQVDCQRAFAAGLHFRPLAATIRETLGWRLTQPADAVWPAGLSPTREREVLAAWHAEHS